MDLVLELLKEYLNIDNQLHWTFISDQQKGLDAAFAEGLPGCQHRYCVQHMYTNFKKKHPGKALKTLLWKIVASSTIQQEVATLSELEAFDREAHGWVKKAKPI